MVAFTWAVIHHVRNTIFSKVSGHLPPNPIKLLARNWIPSLQAPLCQNRAACCLLRGGFSCSALWRHESTILLLNSRLHSHFWHLGYSPMVRALQATIISLLIVASCSMLDTGAIIVSADDTQSQVLWQSAFWASISLTLNPMTQPSRRVFLDSHVTVALHCGARL